MTEVGLVGTAGCAAAVAGTVALALGQCSAGRFGRGRGAGAALLLGTPVRLLPPRKGKMREDFA